MQYIIVFYVQIVVECRLTLKKKKKKVSSSMYVFETSLFVYPCASCIDHFRITAIWPGDRIRRPEHPTENEVRRCSCDESV